MSLSSIFGIGVSGLQSAQTQLRAISDNIANIDTKGYVRKVVDQEPLVTGGIGNGVAVSQIRLATDRFLQAAGLKATADASGAAAASSLWDQAQSLFGDPTGKTGFFAGIDDAFSAFSTLAANPNSSAAKSTALDQLNQVFASANSIGNQLDGITKQADSRIASDVDTVNRLLIRIDSLNAEATRAKLQGGDPTGPESQQMQLVDQLSTMLQVQVQPRDQGGVLVRTSDGQMLAGQGAAVLSYDTSGPIGVLSFAPPNSANINLSLNLGGGELSSLIAMRNTELPNVKGELAELVSGVAEAANKVHNGFSASPPPTSLNGRPTGLPLPSAVNGFTGKSTVAILDSSGLMQRKVDIDFSAGTMSVNGAAATGFTPATFLASLNTALGGSGSASYSASGALSLSATGGNGVAVVDPATGGSDKAGKGFSQFFGLNDLVSASVPYDFSSGLTATDPHGFTPGGVVQFQIASADASQITNVSFPIPAAATTMAGLVTALNQPVGGIGLYGTFSLAPDGQLAFTSNTGNSLSVAKDNSTRADGLSLSQAFGIGAQARNDRAGAFSVKQSIVANPSQLAMGAVDATVAVGARALSAGDARGADALGQAGLTLHNFDAAGDLGKITQSVSDYASSLSGMLARKAQTADADQLRSEALATEANARRSSVEGVNLDQELVNLTTYQQAYNASTRLIQAAKDMYDVLLGLMD